MISIRHTARQPGRVARMIALSLCLLFVFAATGPGCKDEPAGQPGTVKKKLAPRPPAERTPDPAPGAALPSDAGPETPGRMPVTETDGQGTTAGALAPDKRRDPFRSFVQLKDAVPSVRKAPARPLTPLEKYSLDQLRVVGVIDGGPVQKALLEDDVGKGYVVGVGDAVGNQGGRIVSIKPDRIVIQETSTDALGEEKVRHITKRLYAVNKDG